MISKLIVHGEDRNDALDKMRDSLDSYVIHGLNHNIPFLRSILDHPKFISGDITTKFIEDEYPGGFSMDHIMPMFTENDYNFLICTAAKLYTLIRNDMVNINQLNIEFNDTMYNIEINTDGDIIINDNKQIFNVCTNYNIGDFVFESVVNDSSAICQLISNKSANEMVLQFKGLKFGFNIRIPQEENLFPFVPKAEVLDLERVLLAPMPG
eukprot:UN05483